MVGELSKTRITSTSPEKGLASDTVKIDQLNDDFVIFEKHQLEMRTEQGTEQARGADKFAES